MGVAAWIMIALGAGASLVTLTGDILKSRSNEPYAATGLWQPEIHVVLALLTGGGSWMLWGWIVAVAVFVVHTAIGMFVALKICR